MLYFAALLPASDSMCRLAGDVFVVLEIEVGPFAIKAGSPFACAATILYFRHSIQPSLNG
jgi:hypothetical protein